MTPVPLILPVTSLPACPTAVESGQPAGRHAHGDRDDDGDDAYQERVAGAGHQHAPALSRTPALVRDAVHCRTLLLEGAIAIAEENLDTIHGQESQVEIAVTVEFAGRDHRAAWLAERRARAIWCSFGPPSARRPDCAPP